MYTQELKNRADNLPGGYQVFRGSLDDHTFLNWASRSPEPFVCLDKNGAEFYVDPSTNRLLVPRFTQRQRDKVNKAFDSSRWNGSMFHASDDCMAKSVVSLLEATS